LRFQSYIEVPEGYEATVQSCPKASVDGLIARTEPFFQGGYPEDPVRQALCGKAWRRPLNIYAELARTLHTTILLEATNQMASMWSRPKDYLHVRRGTVLASIRFRKIK
jgi:hypothetical protein